MFSLKRRFFACGLPRRNGPDELKEGREVPRERPEKAGFGESPKRLGPDEEDEKEDREAPTPIRLGPDDRELDPEEGREPPKRLGDDEKRLLGPLERLGEDENCPIDCPYTPKKA